MSNQSPFAGRTAQAFPTLPRGDVLGTYESYPDAQRVVAKLAEADFPVAKISIVGNDLKTVERVTGKMTYGRAAIAGALSGLWLGIFFGIVLTLFSPSAGGLILAAAIIGAAFGMLYGIVSFAITKRQRDFTSVHQVLATNYQIVVDPQLTGQARQILGKAGIAPATHWNPGTPGAPGVGGPGTPGAPGSGQGGQGFGQGGQGPWSGQQGSGQQGGPGWQGQPQQQPWRPGPNDLRGGQQGSPYGGHATPHQPGGAQHPGTSAPAGQTEPPRYGTNEGPRYGETPGQGAPAAPSSAPRSVRAPRSRRGTGSGSPARRSRPFDRRRRTTSADRTTTVLRP